MSIIADAVRATALLATAAWTHAAAPNTITFENQSGSAALVKLVGPTRGALPVPDRSRATIHVEAGKYYVLVRYGSAGHFSYTRGREFSVEGSAAAYSVITITLHKVVNGNDASWPASQAEFDQQ
jgi:hypothetical protein